jgi:hypothetical protein
LQKYVEENKADYPQYAGERIQTTWFIWSWFRQLYKQK